MSVLTKGYHQGVFAKGGGRLELLTLYRARPRARSTTDGLRRTAAKSYRSAKSVSDDDRRKITVACQCCPCGPRHHALTVRQNGVRVASSVHRCIATDRHQRFFVCGQSRSTRAAGTRTVLYTGTSRPTGSACSRSTPEEQSHQAVTHQVTPLVTSRPVKGTGRIHGRDIGMLFGFPSCQVPVLVASILEKTWADVPGSLTGAGDPVPSRQHSVETGSRTLRTFPEEYMN